MPAAAFNEHLLNNISVGIAQFDASEQKLIFCNEAFADWFENTATGTLLPEVFPDLDEEVLRVALESSGQYTTEIERRRKRHTKVLALTISLACICDSDVLIIECENVTRMRELEAIIDSHAAMVEQNVREVRREKERAETLLLNIMPRAAYEEYKSFGSVASRKYDPISVLSLDFVDLAEAIDALAPTDLARALFELRNGFDSIAEQFCCAPVRTTGNAYLCVAGMHDPRMDHAIAVANVALRIAQLVERRNEKAGSRLRCRIGLGCGSAIGSLIGAEKYVYDIVGDAVAAAADARDSAMPMEVLAARGMAEALTGTFDLVPRDCQSGGEKGIMALAAI